MPTPLDIARFVVTHPEHYADRPWVFRQGWVLLKEAAGQTVDLDRLGPPQHRDWMRPTPALVAELDARRARVSATVRAIMAGRRQPSTPEGAA